MLLVNSPLVSADWLFSNIDHQNLVVLNATIPKVTESNHVPSEDKECIHNAFFFDLKNDFSDTNAAFPNTVLKSEEFELKAQKLGISKDSCLVVYDDIGMYSSARVWWNFQHMGFQNIAVLDGGFPAWKLKGYPTSDTYRKHTTKGDFKARLQPDKIVDTNTVLRNIDNEAILIADARSEARFHCKVPEPRKGLQGGHIPNSINLPFSELIENGCMISEQKLIQKFNRINPSKKEFIFTCGSGITASILALAAELAGVEKYAVYDGSWTAWASTEGLPIEK